MARSEGLRKQYRKVTVVEDVRFVDNGQIVTTAGVSAGIDGALHVVARLLGDEKAWEAARGMQYVWEPPLAEGCDERGDRIARCDEGVGVPRLAGGCERPTDAIVAKHPDDMDAAYHLGMSQVNAGEVDKGLANVERAIKSGRSDTRSQVAYAAHPAGGQAVSGIHRDVRARAEGRRG
jgi:hypothetical protein